MITINLLPFELRPIKRTPLPYILSGAAALVVLAAIGSTWLNNQAEINAVRAELDGNLSELNSLQAVVKEYNDLSGKKAQLIEQVRAIEEIVSDRIIWSRQLYNLSRLLVENAWYKSVKVTFKSFSETQMVMNPQTQKLEPRTITVQKPVLQLVGYVLPGTEGRTAANPLLRNFENDPEFSALFQLEAPSIKDTILEGVPVREFSLEYVVGATGRAGS